MAGLADGGMLVTDPGANSLLRVHPDQSISTVAMLPARDFGFVRLTESVPTGLAVGPDGAR